MHKYFIYPYLCFIYPPVSLQGVASGCRPGMEGGGEGYSFWTILSMFYISIFMFYISIYLSPGGPGVAIGCGPGMEMLNNIPSCFTYAYSCFTYPPISLQGARVWLPDVDLVWRGAELLEDFKSAPCELRVQFEDAEVWKFVIFKGWWYTVYPYKRSPSNKRLLPIFHSESYRKGGKYI